MREEAFLAPRGMTSWSGSLLAAVTDAAVNTSRNKPAKGFCKPSSHVNPGCEPLENSLGRMGVLGTPSAWGSGAAPTVPALHPQGCMQASAAPRDARAASNRSRSWKPSLGRAQQRSILLLDSATRSNSLFERNTNKYPEKPFFPATRRVPEALAGVRRGPSCGRGAGCCWVLRAPCQARAAAAFTCFSKIWAARKVNYIFKFLQLSNLVAIVSS